MGVRKAGEGSGEKTKQRCGHSWQVAFDCLVEALGNLLNSQASQSLTVAFAPIPI